MYIKNQQRYEGNTFGAEKMVGWNKPVDADIGEGGKRCWVVRPAIEKNLWIAVLKHIFTRGKDSIAKETQQKNGMKIWPKGSSDFLRWALGV